MLYLLKIKDTFAVIPIRWIVERTFSWIGNYRILSKYYERYASTEENIARIAVLRLTLRKCI
ncbi:MAG: transposase [Sulfurovaceae bacterium]|nr:transposase [Sulfurovaceae bacterium]